MAKKEDYGVFLHVEFFREGKMFIAYTPSLDLSTCGKTFEEAKRNFKEAVDIFFEECIKDGTIQDVLESCGWVKSPQNGWRPPVFVGDEDINVPRAALVK